MQALAMRPIMRPRGNSRTAKSHCATRIALLHVGTVLSISAEVRGELPPRSTAMSQHTPKTTARDAPSQGQNWPYTVELWDGDGRALQRVLARAFNGALARAIVKAAQKEYPERRILVRRGTRKIADSAD